MYLLDTNIFLEILLSQSKKETCKKFIINNSKNCFVSDFTLYSIGIVLFRKKLFDDYKDFSNDLSEIMNIISLPYVNHTQLANEGKKVKLDFDDMYQYHTARHHNLSIVTMDKDFKVIKDIPVLFL